MLCLLLPVLPCIPSPLSPLQKRAVAPARAARSSRVAVVARASTAQKSSTATGLTVLARWAWCGVEVPLGGGGGVNRGGAFWGRAGRGDFGVLGGGGGRATTATCLTVLAMWVVGGVEAGCKGGHG